MGILIKMSRTKFPYTRIAIISVTPLSVGDSKRDHSRLPTLMSFTQGEGTIVCEFCTTEHGSTVYADIYQQHDKAQDSPLGNLPHSALGLCCW